jgi:hypothetical protein
MLSECLDVSSMCLGVPFIALRQLGAVGDKLGRPNLPSVEWHTGQSGAPPDNYCSLSGARFLPNWVQTTIAALGPLVHRTQSGAPHRSLELPRVARRFRSRPLALATVGSPDSLVNYSRTPPLSPESGEFTRTGPAHRTLSGAPPDSPVCQAELEFATHTQLFFQFFSHYF